MITVEDVRKRINKLTDSYVDDDVISQQIVLAKNAIEILTQGMNVTEQQKDDVILHLATFYTYQAYLVRIQHQLGEWPSFADRQLRMLEDEVNKAIKRSFGLLNDSGEISTFYGIPPVASYITEDVIHDRS